jgi:hypothetical protein
MILMTTLEDKIVQRATVAVLKPASLASLSLSGSISPIAPGPAALLG